MQLLLVQVPLVVVVLMVLICDGERRGSRCAEMMANSSQLLGVGRFLLL